MNVKEFLDQDKIRELISENKLEDVYYEYYPINERYELSKYLLDLGINPIDYFELTIPTFTFYQCQKLTDADIPDGVTSIGKAAFNSCKSLTSVFIPSTVVAIGEEAFQACDSLENVTFGENSELSTIFSGVFTSCKNLTNIVIPDSVTSIDAYVFRWCTGLTNIHYKGTREQWKNINRHPYWYSGSAINLVHCKDGDIAL